MNHSPRFRLRSLTLAVLILTVLAALLRCLAFCFAFDRDPGYFAPGVIPTLLYIVTAVGVIVPLIYLVLLRFAKAETFTMPGGQFRTLPEWCLSIAVAACMLAAAFGEIRILLSSDASPVFPLVRLVLALGALPYFLIRRPARGAIVSGVSAVFYLLSVLITDYFDWTVTTNSPVKQGTVFGALAVAFFILNDLHRYTGDARPGRAFVSYSLAALFGVSVGASAVVAAFCGEIIQPITVLRSLPLLALGADAFSRLLLPQSAISAPSDISSKEE